LSIKTNEIQINGYKSIFEIENILRFSFHNYFLQRDGENYFNIKNFPEYKSRHSSKPNINIVETVKNRMNQRDFYVEKRTHSSHLWYLDLAILIELYDNFWETHTNKLFTTDHKSEIIPFLKNVLNARNDIAHNRPINKEKLSYIDAAKSVLSSKIRKKYLLAIDDTFDKNQKLIAEKISFEINKALNNIEKLEIIKDTEYLNQLLSSFFILRDEKYDTNIIKYFNKYNSIPRNIDRGKKAINYLNDTKVIYKSKELIQLVESINGKY